MQLKTVGESLNVLKDIDNVMNGMSSFKGMSARAELSRRLAEATKAYSTEAVKLALAETTLNETQVKRILVEKGLTGEVLETTTAEISNTIATNANSTAQAKGVASATAYSNAFKGLGVSIVNATKSMWAFLTTTPVGWLIGATAIVGGIVGLFDLVTVSAEEKAEALSIGGYVYV